MAIANNTTCTKIGPRTFVPIGLVAGLVVGAVSVTFALASDRQKQISRIERNEHNIGQVLDELRDQRLALRRIELKLGTLPIEEISD